MLRILGAAALWLLGVSPLFAVSAPIPLPPLKYDHTFRGRIVVKLDSRTVCGREFWGCTIGRPERDGCVIHLSPKGTRFDDQVLDARGFARLVRHETGHCNGWPGNHPGARR